MFLTKNVLFILIFFEWIEDLYVKVVVSYRQRNMLVYFVMTRKALFCTGSHGFGAAGPGAQP